MKYDCMKYDWSAFPASSRARCEHMTICMTIYMTIYMTSTYDYIIVIGL